jgi:hypothetical protein
MHVLTELAYLAGSFGAGRVWQWNRNRKALRASRLLGEAFNTISDIADQRRKAEQNIRTSQNRNKR